MPPILSFPDLAALLLPLCAAAVTAALVLSGLAWAFRPRQHLNETDQTLALLFEGERLIDATPGARALMQRKAPKATDREALVQVLSARFPDLRRALAEIDKGGVRHIASARQDATGQDATGPDATGPDWIEAEGWNGLVRLTLRSERARSEHARSEAGQVHALTLAAMEEELELLRALGDDAPQPIWKQDRDGVITWANRAYLDLADMAAPLPESVAPPWPPLPLFPQAAVPKGPQTRAVHRASIQPPHSGSEQWFEITSLRRGGGSIHFALDANAAVRAEKTRRDFTQTLTRIFAQLSIGLAIFDRDRRLMLFNPALLDLTGLPVAFLSSRPPLRTFLDRLREARALPEPRDYSTWRAEMEDKAEKGTYCQFWTLPDGRTYRVTGRPHPDGAIAFLIEDVTADLSLTRRFRSQIETEQAVLDAMPEAVAVFTAGGTLTLTNHAYESLWNARHKPSVLDNLGDTRLAGEIGKWRAHCAPTPLWTELQSVLSSGLPQNRDGTVRLKDGREMRFRFVQLPGGAMMAGFSAQAAAADRIAAPA